ncbi:hypothetical protein OG252_19065 [Streptomyces sp. NBC_01352]|uniref:Uncharacterized protein n=1 Tax=Streptomyces plumbiresistens TaxID=511811 RepID=A0ABP7Q2W4_9ACTN|nr:MULTISPECIES: hypothetical protein [unclassified Streptomyces]MCX4698126.1 hypothetical protein [Streptomyces sp. NBC_01373]
MTKARSLRLAQREAGTDNLPAVRDVTLGKYTFTPGLAYSALAPHDAMVGDGTWVERQVTEPLLREFLTLLEDLQEELNSRWNGQESSGCRPNDV